ncbi:MAG: ABC transporter permease [Gammaproteobacteria bacterium]|nr:ABC transporter permease [Gammaproteobacteria bacterium]MDH5800366.1 ABC transporter permease [Gammaproteobacteria bacterium]
MKTRYIQTTETIDEYSHLPLWKTCSKIDLIYIVYGLLVLATVLVSYGLGALNWLPSDPDSMDLENMMVAPLTSGYFLGTDYMGRDLLSRLIIGIQAYFVPGLLSIFISLSLGSIMGILSGYQGGRVESVVEYFSNLIDSFPRLVLILLFIAAFTPNIYIIMIVVGLTTAPVVAGLVRGKILFLKQRNFVESAIAMGLPTYQIILKHILWYNCRSILLIQATLGMAEAILIETSLSYLGFGVQEPVPSWGNMVQSGSNYLMQGNFWPSTAPALAILATVLGFHLLGDGLNNVLERKER